MAKEKTSNINIFEIIIVAVVGIIISYVFYLELNSLSNRLSKMEDQISAIQTDVVNLRLQINRAAPKPVISTNDEANPNTKTNP